MAESSAISWTDATWNPWIGCTRISPACDHCYAADWAKRHKKEDLWEGRLHRTSVQTWTLPRRLERQAVKDGRRIRCFVASLSDFFDNQADPAWREEAWAVMRATPHVDFLVLTKRAQNIAKMLPPDWGQGYPNVALGTTVENQAEADRRVPQLLAVPARLRFLSCEPLLGPVTLDGWLPGENGCQSCDDGEGYGNRCSRGDIPREEQCPWRWAVQTVTEHGPMDEHGCPASVSCEIQTIDWVIVGGESGPQARPMHLDWARSLRDQCAAAGVPFHFKQWGTWSPAAWKPERLTAMNDEEYKAHATVCGATHVLTYGTGVPSFIRALGHAPWSCERADEAPDDLRHLPLQRTHERAQQLLDGVRHLAVPSLNPTGAPLP
ncbi:phage Gp37/Gp68 family protein [Rhodovarius crocodyli]|uniref:Phage Gp37/Gp68 family protein n=1 Tax=Rhodovarius crocodyli TaxID=1979269 RepID=A0A437MF93_9PROT|nr:phage Gp37/Gp68 family protein [Rhodovarius crocodyli]RVT96307.1 phage Gp37/Gp68 family protein [Rhodovarius crocodyli]